MDYEGGGPLMTGPNFLTVQCDVLVPAAISGVINQKVAQRLQCKVGVIYAHGCLHKDLSIAICSYWLLVSRCAMYVM